MDAVPTAVLHHRQTIFIETDFLKVLCAVRRLKRWTSTTATACGLLPGSREHTTDLLSSTGRCAQHCLNVNALGLETDAVG